MKGVKELKTRIKAVKGTAQITRAMQLVAASKMKKAQEFALSNRPYAFLFQEILASLEGKLHDIENLFLKERPVRTRGVLVITSDRGLCGPLNTNLMRILSDIQGNVQYFSVGRKGTQLMSRAGMNLVSDFELPDQPTFYQMRPLVEHLMELYERGTIDTIEVAYPAYINTLVQQPVLERLAPMVDFEETLEAVRSRFKMEKKTADRDDRLMVFEPDVRAIVNNLPTFFLKHEIYHHVLEARASEHSARMVAMKTATDNAHNLIDDLTLEYNKARQAGITQEILEISAATLAQS